ncbi:hypothetical protein [Caldivirga sp.]|uniref:hypothetical protein n=1 Tax=Caldivirga sp. TaxID=2080243 RepID=UPI0025C727C5|nr:hypothetical protein [Caldivirga sp.]
MGYLWGINIALSIIQVLILGLMIRNYTGIGFTRTGKMLIGVSVVFLMESIVMTITYYSWAVAGMGPTIALPALVITVMNLSGILILYLVSRL